MNSRDNGKSNGNVLALPPDDIIFGRSTVMRGLRLMIDQMAWAQLPILIYGGTGTGKEVIAGFIHRHSPRKDGPFIKISCAAIPGSLLEAEMFGYEQGAFTGAYSTKPGLVELADNGTLVLDHLSELDVSIQAKLLQLLQDGTFSRVGGEEELKIDTRVICITTRKPEEEVTEGKLRIDLYHRVNTGCFRVPDLRERSEDITIIADYLVRVFNDTFGTKAAPLSPGIRRVLAQYRWPGNIRELENVIRRYVILGYPQTIAEDIARRSMILPPAHLQAPEDLSFRARTEQIVREAETQTILRVLYLNNWNRRKTAQMLNISYRALLYKIRSAGLGDYSPTRGARRNGALVDYPSPSEA
jgi:two-component system response regulator AtoC